MKSAAAGAALAAVLLLVASSARAQGPRHGITAEPLTADARVVTRAVTTGIGPAIGRERTLWFALGGAALGAVTCTAISNYVKDSGSGFTTCTASGYAAFMAGGAVAGIVVALLTDHPASGS